MLIVQRRKNLKKAIEYGRLLEVVNLTARGAASPNVKSVFSSFPTNNATHITNQNSNRPNNSFPLQANYKFRRSSSEIQTPTVASYNSEYVTTN